MNEDITPAPARFVVDHVACLAHEWCVHVAPTLFAMDALWRAAVIRQPTTEAELAAMRRAIDECPVAAILDTRDRSA
ncbi:MAG: ferredoxin [Planctomycetia bacterium]|nr:ferredoxin [Planctomycetia bacterium]